MTNDENNNTKLYYCRTPRENKKGNSLLTDQQLRKEVRHLRTTTKASTRFSQCDDEAWRRIPNKHEKTPYVLCFVFFYDRGSSSYSTCIIHASSHRRGKMFSSYFIIMDGVSCSTRIIINISVMNQSTMSNINMGRVLVVRTCYCVAVPGSESVSQSVTTKIKWLQNAYNNTSFNF